jgi:hypothetical protein
LLPYAAGHDQVCGRALASDRCNSQHRGARLHSTDDVANEEELSEKELSEEELISLHSTDQAFAALLLEPLHDVCEPVVLFIDAVDRRR